MKKVLYSINVTVKLANSASPFKFHQVKIPRQAGLENDKCVFHKQCQLDQVSLCEKHILSFSIPVF